jgi:hypothetical protein
LETERKIGGKNGWSPKLADMFCVLTAFAGAIPTLISIYRRRFGPHVHYHKFPSASSLCYNRWKFVNTIRFHSGRSQHKTSDRLTTSEFPGKILPVVIEPLPEWKQPAGGAELSFSCTTEVSSVCMTVSSPSTWRRDLVHGRTDNNFTNLVSC